MQAKIKRVWVPKFKIFLFITAFIVLFIFVSKGIRYTQSIGKQTGLSAATIVRLLFDNGAELKFTNDRMNILILGIGGGGHEGSDLTDTMIVLSLDTVHPAVALISIPRDIWSETLKDKINSAYHYGEEKKKGGGLTLAKVVTEDVIGISIHYAMVIDFSGFKKMIDLVGGIDINVPKGFVDKDFPIEGRENDECGGDPEFRCRYQEIRFEAGNQHMDGERALMYVRSRHAEGNEGSDFARSRRQQEVLVALKSHLMKPVQWLSISKDMQVFKAVDDMLDTDMTIGELLTSVKMMSRVDQDKIEKISIESYFIIPSQYLYNNRYVLIPENSYETIYSYIRSKLNILQ